MADLNYAKSYSRALAQAFPHVLNFGALYNTENDTRYRFINAKTIEIPVISTSGRVAANRDTIAGISRNYDNSWETKTLSNQRKWSTLVHPQDVDQTNLVTTITNITNVMNTEHKFPEMDAYCVSSIYSAWGTTTDPETSSARVPDAIALTTANVLAEFDKLMLKMDNERVPANGRILYVTHEVKSLLKSAQQIQRTLSVQDASSAIYRAVSRIDEVEVIGVPKTLMQSVYDFTDGMELVDSAIQINMFLVHPQAVITPVSYQFSKLDAPSAGSEGKYVYYEESFEDVFILNNKAGAIQFAVEPMSAESLEVSVSASGTKDVMLKNVVASTSSPATVTSSASGKATATLVGNKLTISGVAAGDATITVVDNLGSKVEIAVTVA